MSLLYLIIGVLAFMRIWGWIDGTDRWEREQRKLWKP
jgi:hypothetical protein